MMSSTSILLFLLLGAVLRLEALNVLTDPVLSALDPAIWASLVAVGILVGAHARIGSTSAAIVMFGIALVSIRSSSSSAIASTLVVFCVAVTAIAAAAWLLVKDTADASEQHVFVLGTVLLLGGTSASLSMSALFGGFLAGVGWRLAGGPARDRLERDISYLQRPPIIMLLLVAGARFEPSIGSFYLAAACVVVGSLTNLLFVYESDGWIGPSVIGIAAGLDAGQAWSAFPESSATVLATVVMVSVGWELLAVLGKSREPVAA